MSALFRLEPKEHIRLRQQDWPVIQKWSKGTPFVNAQLTAFSRALSGWSEWQASNYSGRRFVTMMKAAPHWILRSEWMARWVLSWSQVALH